MNAKHSPRSPWQWRHSFASCCIIAGVLSGCGAAPKPLQHWLTNHNTEVFTAIVQNAPIHGVRFPSSATNHNMLHIYLEGDGRAYLSKRRLSPNPTPSNPIGLQLAQGDATTAEVLYLGRPCQWSSTRCPPEAFTTERFTEAVAADYTALIASQARGRQVLLIGYSGGAWAALQVAARLPTQQVLGVITVAGNLDPNTIHRHHRVKELTVAPLPPAIRSIPQQHWLGADDTVIPPNLGQQLAAALGPCATATVLPGLAHGGHNGENWPKQWPILLAKPLPSCGFSPPAP